MSKGAKRIKVSAWNTISSKIKDVLTGGPGKRAGERLGTGLINMHKKKK